ncbi:MAG: Hemolysin C [Owenweeksia sp. TMED14]|nr:MAG: Hemolysin C [Owenweeksia sp. TMED14]
MIEVLQLLLALLLSAFFSGMELAFLSASRLKVEIESKRGTIFGTWLAFLISKPSNFIGAMLLGNTISLVFVGLNTALLLDPIFLKFTSPAVAVLFETVLSTLVVLFIAEFLPKAFFRNRSNESLKWFILPLITVYFIFLPIVSILTSLSNWLLNRTGSAISTDHKPAVFSRADLEHYIDEGSNSDNIETEIELFKNALDFGEVKVRSCMVPRTEIIAIPNSIDMDSLREKFVQTGLSKLVVYRDNIDDSYAYVHAFGLFRRPKRLAFILTPLSFIPETMSAQEVFKMLIREKRSMASVVDELGSLTGIVTLEDVVEELFGEIDDEHDHDSRIEEKISDGLWRLDASLEVDYLNSMYSFDWPEDDSYSTLAGLIGAKIGHLPSIGESVTVNYWEFTIETMDVQRIGRVLVSSLNRNVK